MVDGATFMDEPHVARIASALWSRKSSGNAAVLVGAGFSANARAVSADAGRLPGWDDLCRRIIDVLIPGDDSGSAERREWLGRQLGATSTYLRLAQEFEAEFRRDALDQLVKRHVPDLKFAPGEMHRLLLDLPWADVLTTNWDTLLERGADLVEDRVYEVVRTVSDLPGSRPPRIVKLHGSLPSNRPFIFTEEDFRTYPDRFAPFVNLARQATMENLLVLIGFSGDDPNFLYWSGWVRDQLGEHAPLVYLVGAMGLTSSTRKMLEQRRVQPIDLAQLPGFERWDVEARHENATRWFLERLRAGEPYRRDRWPKPAAPTVPPPRLAVAARPGAFPRREPFTLGPDDPPDAAEAAIDAWRHNRGLYPGWVVAPRAARALVWAHTEHMLAELLPRMEEMTPAGRLRALDELNWRFEICLVPLWWQVPRLIEEALDAAQDEPAPLGPEAAARVRNLRFGLLRHAREIGDGAGFERHDAVIRSGGGLGANERARLTYERCLLGLSRFDFAAVEGLVSGWVIDGDPFWLVRKAGLLAELGKPDEADRLSNEARIAIRRQTSKGDEDLASWSKEAFALLMRSAFAGSTAPGPTDRPIPDEAPPSTADIRSHFEERLDILASRGCDAWGDLSHFERELNRDPPQASGPRTVRRGFDVGSYSVSYPLLPGVPDPVRGRLDALRALRFQEETGLPPAVNYHVLTRGLFERAAVWLSGALPYRAIVAYLRVATYEGHDDFEAMFSRRAMARLGDADADILIERLRALVDHARPRLDGASAATPWLGRLRVAVELLSRLAVRRPSRAGQLLALGLELYRDRLVGPHPWLSRGVGNLVARSLEAMPRLERHAHALDVLALPIACEPGFGDRWGDRHDPFDACDAREPSVRPERSEAWDEAVARHVAALSLPRTRPAAAGRLLRLHRAGLLRGHEQDAVREALWDWPDREHGVPGGTGLLQWVFVTLPQPDGRPADRAVLALLRERPAGMDMHRWMRNCRMALDAIPHRGGSPIAEEVLVGLVNGLVSWAGAARPRRARPGIEEEEREALRLEASRFLARVCRPCLGSPGAMSAIRSALPALRERTYVEAAIPGLLAAGTVDRAEGVDAIRRGLRSDRTGQVECAASAVGDWTEHGGEFGDVPPAVWEEVGLAIATRRGAAVATALWTTAHAYRRHPDRIPEVVDALAVEGLRAILAETAPDRDAQDLAYDPDLVRERAALLAGQMRRAGRGDPGLASEWSDAAGSDPMPDVRAAFERRWDDGATS